MGILLFLFTAAVYDWRYRRIPGWLYAAGGGDAVLWRIACRWAEEKIWWAEIAGKFMNGTAADLSFGEICGGVGIGVFLLLISRKSGGAVGSGDGMAFIITGLYFGLWRNLCLLWISLTLCSLWGAGLMVIRRTRWNQVKGKEMPFLPFVFPVGVWLTVI